jgi:hypothetical protein
VNNTVLSGKYENFGWVKNAQTLEYFGFGWTEWTLWTGWTLFWGTERTELTEWTDFSLILHKTLKN